MSATTPALRRGVQSKVTNRSLRVAGYLAAASWLALVNGGGALAQDGGAGGEPPVRAETLDPIVVTATRTEQNLSTAPASISVITGEELKTAPVGDLTDAVRNLPGISLTAGSQGRREISIRGMDSSYTLILLDGKRVNSREAVFRHNDYDLGLIPVEAIDRIEVVRGGMSALYGSEALGGVINIITKPFSDTWRGSIDTQVQTPTEGSGGEEYRTSLYVSGALIPDTLGLTVLGGFNRREIWRDFPDEIIPGATRPDGSPVNRADLATLEGREDNTARLRLTWTPDPDHVVEGEYGRSYQTRRGEYFIGNSYGEADTEIIRDDASLTHRGTWGWGNSELRAYWERTEPQVTGTDLVQTNYTIEGNVSAPIGRHYLTLGGEAVWVELEAPAEFASGGASVHQQAIYLQDDIMVTDRLSLLLGARLDHNEYFGSHVTPRGYVVYRATDALTVKGGVSTGFKAPTLRQLSEDSVVTSCRGACLIAGNPDLEPEESTNYEISVAYDRRRWGGSVTAFQNDVENLIDTPRGTGVPPVGTDPATGLPIFVPRNVDRARIRGVEATAYYDILEFARLTANYTFLDARNLDEDTRLDNRPRHSVNGKLDWFIGRDTTVFLRGEYIGEQRSGTETVDGYALFDIGVTHALADNFQVRAGVLNIADQRTGDDDDDYPFVERGRTVYVGASVQF